MSDFSFRIVGDASTADQSIHKVEAGLEDIKRKAKEATDGVQGMSERLEGIGKIASFIGGAAALGGLRDLAQGVENLIHESEALEDRYTTLANHALKFTTATKDVNLVIDEQLALSRQLHADLTQTMNLYDSIGDATDELGLSQRQLNSLTRTLGEGALLAGKSYDSAASVMSRFAIATAAGADGAREVKAILRDFPELGRALADAWATDKAGVIDMVTSGKKGIQDLVDVWVYSSDQIHKAASERKKTHEELRREVMQEAEVALNRGVPALVAYTEGGLKLHDALQKLKNPGRDATEVFNEISRSLQDQADEWQRVEDRARDALRKEIIEGSQLANEALKGLGASVKGIADALISDGFYAINKAADPWFVKPETPKKVEKVREELDAYQKLLLELEKPEKDAIERYNLLGQLYMNGAISAERYHTELEKVRGTLMDLGKMEMPSVTQGLALPSPIDTSGIDTASLVQSTQVDYLTEAWHREIEANEKAAAEAEKMGAAFSPLKDSIVEMFRDGEFSGEKLLGTLEDISIKLLEMAAINAITGGIGGGTGGFLKGLLGGKNGFDYAVDGSSLQLPGFASGGSFRVGGTGGTDTSLVAFRATPGESVHVRTPQQRAQEEDYVRRGGDSGRVTVQNVVQVQSDPREITRAMGSRAGQVEFVKLNRQFSRRR